MQTDIVTVIKQFTDYIRGRRKGREARASIADAIDKIAEEAATAIGTLNGEFHYAGWLRPASGETEVDLNELVPNMIWAVDFSQTDVTYLHKPDRANTASLLLCYGDRFVVYQLVVGLHGNIWSRRYMASKNIWTAWAGGIDTTLSVADAAADSAAVGQRFSSFSNTAITADGALSSYDLNNISSNSVYELNFSANTYQNAPPGASGVAYLVTMLASQANGWQIMYGSVGRMFARRRTVNGWDQWYSLDDRIGRLAVTNDGVSITAANKGDYFSDFNDAPLNKIFRINRGAQLANSPFGDGMSSASGVYDGTYRDVAGYMDGTLMTCGSSTYKYQMFVSGYLSSSAPPNEATIFYRVYCSISSPQWGAWRCASDLRSPSATNIAIRRKFIGRWLNGNGLATNTETETLNPQYMSDYLAPYIDGSGTPVPVDKGGYAANPNYERSHRYFNDFNDAPFNSIYQIDLDCVSEIMANNPRPGKSSVLVTTGFSWSGMQHGKIQLCVGTDSGSTFAYVRYGYIQSVSQGIYIWTNWLHFASADEVDALKARVAALEASIAALSNQ